MEDVEAGRRISRRKRKLSARQGVVIGVAAVAGLGLMTKLLSLLRREKPKKVEDGDLETLEAVLSGDAAKTALPALTKEVHVFANLENDEPGHEGTNGHEVSSKDAEPESLEKDDVTEDRDTHATEASEPVSQEEVTVKEAPHSNGEEVEAEGKRGKEDAGEHQVEVEERKVNGAAAVTEPHVEEQKKPHIEDAESLLRADVVELPIGDEVKPHIEDAVEANAEDKAKQPNGDALEALVEDAKKLELPFKSEDAAELKNEDEARPQPGAAVEQLIGNGEKLEGEGKQAIADAAEPIPTKAEEKHQNGEKLETKDEGKQTVEDAVELIPTNDDEKLENGETFEIKDEGTQAIEEAAEVIPTKVEEKHQPEKFESEEAAKLES